MIDSKLRTERGKDDVTKDRIMELTKFQMGSMAGPTCTAKYDNFVQTLELEII